jgi:hypothetical protein
MRERKDKRSQQVLGTHNETLSVVRGARQQSRSFARWNQSLRHSANPRFAWVVRCEIAAAGFITDGALFFTFLNSLKRISSSFADECPQTVPCVVKADAFFE